MKLCNLGIHKWEKLCGEDECKEHVCCKYCGKNKEIKQITF